MAWEEEEGMVRRSRYISRGTLGRVFPCSLLLQWPVFISIVDFARLHPLGGGWWWW